MLPTHSPSQSPSRSLLLVCCAAGVQAGFGGASSYLGKLLPFAGYMIYQKNPTISYTPVAGSSHRRGTI